MPKKWLTLSSDYVQEFRIFRLRMDRCVSPRTGASHDFVVLEGPDWVNVIALTPEDNVVLIQQYRFGAREVTLEIPGGMVDAGETPRQAAERELLEETGYQAERWVALGAIAPNPAIQQNRCHSFLALGCRRVAAPAQEDMEDIAVEERPLIAVPDLLAGGAITHALVAVAFQKLDLWQRGLLKPPAD